MTTPSKLGTEATMVGTICSARGAPSIDISLTVNNRIIQSIHSKGSLDNESVYRLLLHTLLWSFIVLYYPLSLIHKYKNDPFFFSF